MQSLLLKDLFELKTRKKWRSSCVCLLIDALEIEYKAKSNSKFRIDLTELIRVQKKAVPPRLLCLEIRSQHATVVLSCLTIRQAMTWHGALSASLQRWAVPRSLPSSLIEVNANTTVYVITAMKELKVLLFQREQDLISELEHAYDVAIAQTRSSIDRLSTILYSQSARESVRETVRKSIMSATTETVSVEGFSPIPELVDVTFNSPLHLLSRYMHSAVSIQRKHAQEQTVRRCERLQEVSWCYSPDRFDAVTFQVDANVCLLGLAINSPCWEGEFLCVNQLKVLSGPRDKSKIIYTHPEHEYAEYTGQPTFQIRFSQPVFIQAKTHYTILAQIFGDDSFKCFGCSPAVKTSDGLQWTFTATQFHDPEVSNNTGPTKGIFPELYYYKT